MAELPTFVINRDTWLHPEARRAAGNIPSTLRHPETGLECCLGQLGRQLGIAPCALDNRTMPASLDKFNRARFPDGMFRPRNFEEHTTETNSDVANRIAELNDGARPEVVNEADPISLLSLADREVAIAAEFSTIGILVTFTGDPQVAIQKGLDYSANLKVI